MKSKKVPWQKAQGDLLVEQVAEVPDGFKPMDRDEHGRLVAASGEATGHHHVIRSPGVCMLAREGCSDRVVTLGDELAELLHDQGAESYVPTLDHAPLTLDAPTRKGKTLRIIKQREWVGQGVRHAID